MPCSRPSQVVLPVKHHQSLQLCHPPEHVQVRRLCYSNLTKNCAANNIDAVTTVYYQLFDQDQTTSK